MTTISPEYYCTYLMVPHASLADHYNLVMLIAAPSKAHHLSDYGQTHVMAATYDKCVCELSAIKSLGYSLNPCAICIGL